jgi:hypothetical protein
MTPRSLGTKPEKMKNSEDPIRKLSNLAGQGASSNPKRLTTRVHMQIREDSRRLGNRHRAKEAAGWDEVGPG